MRALLIMLGALALTGVQASAGSNGDTAGPVEFDDSGKMLFPDDYRSWVFVTAGHGMSYDPEANSDIAAPFDNVFADRAAYNAFLETGTWPDGTALALEIRGASSHGSINRAGAFQTGEPLAIEFHVKDTARFGGDGWAFFSFGSDHAPSTMIPREEACYSCHEANTAVDRTFVQFYPTLLPIARAKGTISPEYMAQEAGTGH